MAHSRSSFGKKTETSMVELRPPWALWGATVSNSNNNKKVKLKMFRRRDLFWGLVVLAHACFAPIAAACSEVEYCGGGVWSTDAHPVPAEAQREEAFRDSCPSKACPQRRTSSNQIRSCIFRMQLSCRSTSRFRGKAFVAHSSLNCQIIWLQMKPFTREDTLHPEQS